MRNLARSLRFACMSALVFVAAACVPISNPASTTPAPTTSIQDVVWEWVSVTDQPTRTTTDVPNPMDFTITFRADGTLSGQADCNTFTGTYSQEEGFIIELDASTMAACGDASLDQDYLQLLGSVVAGGPDGAGGLALENAGGEKRMLFQNGGPASALKGQQREGSQALSISYLARHV